MLIADQVEILRKNLPEIKRIKCALPLGGGYSDTKTAYHFAYLVLPARDIITTIQEADPSGRLLPAHLRGWNIKGMDEYQNEVQIPLKRILGMIIHMHYLHFHAEKLDVSNDSNERIIVARDVFLQQIERLVLTREDICLVACALAEKSLSGKTGKISPWDAEAPGCRDLQKILREIDSWPELKEMIWENYFKKQSETISSDSDVIDSVPFIKGTRSTMPKTSWHLGWRRGLTYSDAWIDVTRIIATIRGYIQ